MVPMILLSALLSGAEPTPSLCWPSFRGDGSSVTTARHLPLHWSASENVAWKVSLPGYGQSAPIVWRGQVYVTAVDGKEKEKCLVLALSSATGQVVWRKEFAASQKGKNVSTTSRAAPTPVADASGVFILFETGDLLALGHDGELKWQRSLVKEYGEWKGPHGLGSSPAQTDKAVIVLVDHTGPSYLLAVDKATGKNLWKTERGPRMSWTSPLVAMQEGQPIVLVSGNGTLIGYDAATGKQSWELAGLSGNTIPLPTIAGELVVLGAGQGRMNKDANTGANSNCCVRLTHQDGKPAAEMVWRGAKVTSHHASPLIYQGLVYFVTQAGLVHALDVKTGEPRFVERLDNECWATPVAAGRHVYFFGKDGVTTVLEAGPRFVPVARNRLWKEDEFSARKEAAKKQSENERPRRPASPEGTQEEPAYYAALGDVVYGVAVVEGAFYLRTGTELYCIREASGGQKEQDSGRHIP